MPRKLLIIFFLLTLLVIVFKLPSLGLSLDNDSAATAFIARQMMRGDILYDKYHPAHHLPGIYYTFLFAFKLFGDNPVAPKLLLLPFAIASTWLIFLLGRAFFDDQTGILGAFFYTLVSSQVLFSGTTAEMEHFANLPLIATIFIFLILLRKNAPAIQFIWVGMIGAICILYKIVFIGSLAAVGFAILIGAWLERDQAGNGKKYFFRLASITIGLILPLVFVGGYFTSMGLWQRLMLVFTLGFNYFNDNALLAGGVIFPRPFGFPLFVMAVNNTPLLGFGLIGTYRLIRRSIPMQTVENLPGLILALWMIISLASTGLRGGGYEHYALVVIPPLALTGGYEISHAYQRWQISSFKKHALLGAGIMTTMIIINFFWINYELYKNYVSYTSSQIFRKNSAIQYYPDSQQAVVDYIKTHTSPDDLIYIWSDNVTLYYSADRLPPIDILWPFYVSATGPPERIFNLRTKYIILDDIDVLPRPQWLINGLDQNYFLETTIIGKEIYRRTTP